MLRSIRIGVIELGCAVDACLQKQVRSPVSVPIPDGGAVVVDARAGGKGGHRQCGIR